MSRPYISYKLLLENLLAILKKELSRENYLAIIDLLCISYKFEVEKEWKSFLNFSKK